MDKFQATQQKMMLMRPEEKAQDMDTKLAMCICGKCPSYTDDNRDRQQALFCSKGRPQSCAMTNKGCICSDCPVSSEMGLTHTSYCIKGSERDQRGM